MLMYLSKMFAGHFWHDLMKEHFIFIVYKPVMKDTLSLMNKETEDLKSISDDPWVCLQHS